jgi:hypothetical protein
MPSVLSIRGVGIIAVAFLATAAHAADQPHGYGDITLGDSFQRLATTFDFRDVHAALAEQGKRKTGAPDLGRRGYGCVRRDDAYADVTCVSHDEKVGGAETREIRLQFLGGILQQFSITAEIRHFDTVMEAIRARYGAPERVEPATAGEYPAYRWRNGASGITAFGGKDLVFVSFELATYQEAVKGRQGRVGEPTECR